MTQNEKALQLHKEWNGKIDTTPKCHVKSREDLALAYTPGVAEPCKVIAEDKEQAYTYTIKTQHRCRCLRRKCRTGTGKYRCRGSYACYGRKGCSL